MSKNIMTTDIRQIKSPKLNKAFTIVSLIISALLSLLFLLLFIFTNKGLFRFIISGIWFIRNLICVKKGAEENHFFKSIKWCVIVIPVIAYSSLFAPGIKSKSAWKYDFQRKYIEFYNHNALANMPDEFPDEMTDYRLDYMPSVLQGTGHSSVRFKASQDVIKAYEEEYSAKAIYTYPLSVFQDGSIDVEQISPKADIGIQDDKSLLVYRDTDFWSESTSATVYVTSATHNWNHPHSTAVIIDSEKNMIEFAQLG